jgi:hypothetical protein
MADEPGTQPRPLTTDERADLEKVLSTASFDGVDVLRAQVPRTSVAGGIPTLLDLTVDRSVPPAPVRNGPVPGRWVVEGTDGEVEGELLVWVFNGYLDGFELAWLTEGPPAAFPPPERVRPLTDAD